MRPHRTEAELAETALITLAKECAELGALLDQKIEATDAAQLRQKRIETPKAIIRTEADLALGLFVGKGGIGKSYEREDIALIRMLVRRARRVDHNEGFALYNRGSEILEFWQDWQEEVEEAEAASGYRAAEAAQYEVQDRQTEALKKLAATPALTIIEILAKAQGFHAIFADGEYLAKELEDDLGKFGPDTEALALSLAADLLRLARKAEA
jgi:hypothetical protein